MPLPGPKDGDTAGPTPGSGAEHSAGSPTRKGYDKYGYKVWTPVPGRPGYFTDADGRLKYDPFLDPLHPLGPKP